MRLTKMGVTVIGTRIVFHPPLDLLAAFLNLNFTRRGGPKEAAERTVWNIFGIARKRGKAKRLQEEIRRDITPPGKLEPNKVLSLPEFHAFLQRLVDKVTRIRFDSRLKLSCVDYDVALKGKDPKTGKPTASIQVKRPEDKPYIGPREGTFEVSGFRYGKRAETVRWVVRREIPSPSQMRKALYWIIDQALESGELLNLRQCPQCLRFFVAKDRRKAFCGDNCRKAFSNEQRLESGYFYKLRHAKRKRDLSKARRLLRDGKSIEEIIKETGLSQNVLKRQLLLNRA